MKKIGVVIAGLLMIHFSPFCDRPAAETIYKYTDKDGSVVFTDNPPPGVDAKPRRAPRHVTQTEKQKLEKQKAQSMETESKMNEKAGKIRAASEEYEQAKRDLENYNLNKNQSGDPYLWWQWNKRIEEQSKEVEARRQKLEAIERAP